MNVEIWPAQQRKTDKIVYKLLSFCYGHYLQLSQALTTHSIA